MIIVGERVGPCEIAEIRRIALGHVVEAHGNTALVRAGAGIIAPLRSFARGLVDPDKEIAPAAVELLPHLEEPMHGIAHRGGPLGIARDWKRSVRERRR